MAAPDVMPERVLRRLLALTVMTTAIYRGFVTTANLAPWTLAHPDVRLPMTALLVAFSLYHALALLTVWRRDVRGDGLARRAFGLDAVVMAASLVGFNACMGAVDGHALLDASLLGPTVALTTFGAGLRAGALASVGGLVLSVAIGWWSDTGLMGGVLVAAYSYAAMVLVLMLFKNLLRDGVRESGQIGGDLERRRAQRMIHDTAVQTLEAIALTASVPDPRRAEARAEAALARIAAMASSEVAALRGVLDETGAAAPGGDVIQAVREVLADPLLDGLDAQLSAVGPPVVLADSRVREALTGAVREALLNVVKHAGTTLARVELRAVDGGVQVLVRDEGAGFDTSVPTQGFGWRESVTGRLRAVSGTASVSSRVGQGTTVRLWVPWGDRPAAPQVGWQRRSMRAVPVSSR